jgi:hypothetical protein
VENKGNFTDPNFSPAQDGFVGDVESTLGKEILDLDRTRLA